MNLCVFTCDYAHPPTDCSFLEASCTRVGVALHKFGQGSTWPSYTDRLRDGAVFLQNRPEEFVLFVDSADTYLLDGSEEILRKFHEFNAPFVFSAETNCWPDSSLADHFPWNGTKYRFLNAGAWMGSRSWIIDRWLRIWERYHSQFPQDDTRCLVQAWIDGMNGLSRSVAGIVSTPRSACNAQIPPTVVDNMVVPLPALLR